MKSTVIGDECVVKIRFNHDWKEHYNKCWRVILSKGKTGTEEGKEEHQVLVHDIQIHAAAAVTRTFIDDKGELKGNLEFDAALVELQEYDGGHTVALVCGETSLTAIVHKMRKTGVEADPAAAI